MKKLALVTFVIATLLENASATPPEFLGDKYRGWFFHEVEVERELPKEADKADKQASVPDELKPFTQSWFAKNINRLRDQAIDNPTKENITNFLVAQKIMVDAASNFTAAAVNVTMENPWISGAKYLPTATFGAQFYEKRAIQAKKELIAKLAEKTGIWFFFASSCEACHAQAPVLRDMRDRMGLKILPISIDGKGIPDFPQFQPDRGQAQKYSVTSTPTMLIFREGKLYPLGEGMMASDQLVDRLLYFAKENGWITEKEWNRAQPVDKNDALTPSFIRSITSAEAGNINALANKIKSETSGNISMK